MIGIMVGNVGLWPAKTFEWGYEMLTIAKLIKIKVLLHQFWNLVINLT